MRKLLLILSLLVINIVGLAYEKCNPKTIYEIRACLKTQNQ